MNVDELRDFIRSYSLNNGPHGNQGFTRILLQLFGYLGHGKSSLINSCKHVLQDREKEFTMIAQSGAADGGLTMERKSYQLTQTLTMVDNRGCATLNGYETGEVYAQLGNFIPLDQTIEWSKEFGEMVLKMQAMEVEPNYSDLIVPVLVYSVKRDLNDAEAQEIRTFLTNCRTLTGNFIPLDQTIEWSKEFGEMMIRMEEMEVEPNYSDLIVPIFVYSVKRDLSDAEAQEIKTFLTNCCTLTGIFPIVVLTHKTSGNFSKLRDLFEGMGAEEIHAVENYTSEDHNETRGRHLQFLNLLYKVLEDVTFKMQKKIDSKQERAKHRTFLYSFFHTWK